MQDELQAFLEAPTARSYRRVREALLDELTDKALACDSLPPDLSAVVLAELADLLATGEYAVLARRTEELQPAWALSPRVHFYAAVAADERDDAEGAELERFLFQSCLEGILATGDGTANAPYLITYLSDEYDVLAALGLDPQSQRLTEQRGILFDVIRCVDGEEVWFELTGVLHDPRQQQAEFAALQGIRI